jgi:hypothetical protein
LSWIGLRITFEQILGLSYGPVLQDIINDMQQNNVGQSFDNEYIINPTIRMLLHYSSHHVIFHLFGSNIDNNPAIMVVGDWHIR